MAVNSPHSPLGGLAPLPPGLRAEVHAVQDAHPGWTCWVGRDTRMHALCTSKGIVAVAAPTPVLLHHEIAVKAHQLGLAA